MSSKKKDGQKKKKSSREKMSGKQLFWGILAIVSLLVMSVTGFMAVQTADRKSGAPSSPSHNSFSAVAETVNSFLAGREQIMFAMDTGKDSLGKGEDPAVKEQTQKGDSILPSPSGLSEDEGLDLFKSEGASGKQESSKLDGTESKEDETTPDTLKDGEEEYLDGPVIALTFDDGPYTSVTNRIVDVLLEYNAGATFFVVGSRLDMYSDTLKKIYDSGFEVASHTWSHKDLSKLTAEEIEKEIGDTVDGLNKYISVENVLLRPPYGSANETVRSLVGTPLINWSLDSQDWKSRDADKIIRHVLDTVQDGDIILMHDLYECTAEAVEYLVPELIMRGYHLVSVSELFCIKKISLEEGILYRKPGDHY